MFLFCQMHRENLLFAAPVNYARDVNCKVPLVLSHVFPLLLITVVLEVQF